MALARKLGAHPTLSKWRWDLIAIGGASITLWLLTTPLYTHFLDVDTPNQDFAALGLVNGCWEIVTEKYLAVFLLTPFFRLFGPSVIWETGLLALAAGLTAVASYELTFITSKSRTASLFAVLLAASLPAYQLFIRTYFGYLIPCLLLGWLAARNLRLGWAGLCFGLAILAHFNAIATVGLSSLALLILYFRKDNWRQLFLYIAGMLIPILLVEGVTFLFVGHNQPFAWSRRVIRVVWGYSGIEKSAVSPDWVWLLKTVIGSNGWIPALWLSTGLAAPYWLRRHKIDLAMSLTVIANTSLYVLIAGFGKSFTPTRLLASLYPFGCILAAIVVEHMLTRLIAPRLVLAGRVVLLTLVAMTMFTTSIFITKFSQTTDPYIEEWFQQAAQARQPVRFQGWSVIAAFFGQREGVEFNANATDWADSNSFNRNILIFTSASPAQLSRTGYTVSVVHLDTSADDDYPELTKEAETSRQVELWWPVVGPAQPVKPTHPSDDSRDELYYPGQGCVTPPLYENGTMHYYQLVLKKFTDWLPK